MGSCNSCLTPQDDKILHSLPSDSRRPKSAEIIAPVTGETEVTRDKRATFTYENGAKYTGEWYIIILYFVLDWYMS